ncbi:hypothetical protein JCM10213v2_002679 [Rhodosporidiobolus nylandii]
MKTPTQSRIALPPTPTSNSPNRAATANAIDLSSSSPSPDHVFDAVPNEEHAPSLLLDIRCTRHVQTGAGLDVTLSYSINPDYVLWSSVDKDKVVALTVIGEHELVDLLGEVLPRLATLTFHNAFVDVGGATHAAVSRAFPALATLVLREVSDQSQPGAGLLDAFSNCDIQRLAVFFDKRRPLRKGWQPVTFSGDDHELLLVGLRVLAAEPVTGHVNVDALGELEGLVVPSTFFLHNVLYDDSVPLVRRGQNQSLHNLVRLRLLPVDGDIIKGPELRLQA